MHIWIQIYQTITLLKINFKYDLPRDYFDSYDWTHVLRVLKVALVCEEYRNIAIFSHILPHMQRVFRIGPKKSAQHGFVCVLYLVYRNNRAKVKKNCLDLYEIG